MYLYLINTLVDVVQLMCIHAIAKKINAKQISTEKGIHLLYCFIIYQKIF